MGADRPGGGAVFYAVPMTATVGSYQLLILVILAATALLFIRRRPRRAGK